jgi:hypothetical protein
MSKKDPECVKVVVRCRPLSRKEVEDQVSRAWARFASFACSVRWVFFPPPGTAATALHGAGGSPDGPCAHAAQDHRRDEQQNGRGVAEKSRGRRKRAGAGRARWRARINEPASGNLRRTGLQNVPHILAVVRSAGIARIQVFRSAGIPCCTAVIAAVPEQVPSGSTHVESAQLQQSIALCGVSARVQQSVALRSRADTKYIALARVRLTNARKSAARCRPRSIFIAPMLRRVTPGEPKIAP